MATAKHTKRRGWSTTTRGRNGDASSREGATRLTSVPSTNVAPTWFVLAHRSEARIYASDGGVKNLRLLDVMPHPKGRLKGREIETDRGGASMAEGAANFPRHGAMENKGEATFRVMQGFMHDVADVLRLARTRGDFTRLVLVAEPRVLGELRSTLDPETASLVVASIDKTYKGDDIATLKERLQANLLPDEA